MTPEEARVRLRTKLESAFGAEEASILMDRPPAGLRASMDRGFQVQTWRLMGAVFVAFGLFATLVRLT